MIKKLFIILCLLGLIIPAYANPIILDDDPGGSVNDNVKWFKRVKDSGNEVRVEGLCISACTLVFMLPKEQFCVGEHALFGFHMAMDKDNEQLVEQTAILMHRFMPQAIVKWFVENYKPNKENKPIYLTPEVVIKMDVARACPK